ncbi:MAG: hypothetical protein VX529_06835 [Pseudomonadota bacterium]|jgi:hypothetical protein|nr:hypothetical protein [Pseudomonadota bacterium]
MMQFRPGILPAIVAGASGLVVAACQQGAPADTLPPATIEMTYYAHETEDGICQPRGVARVNVSDTDLYAVYGSVEYTDIHGGGTTRLPLQHVFYGYDSDGIGVSEVRTGIDTDTACEDLRIDHVVDHCLLNSTRPAEEPCPRLELSGEGFAGLVLKEDDSQPADRNTDG